MQPILHLKPQYSLFAISEYYGIFIGLRYSLFANEKNDDVNIQAVGPETTGFTRRAEDCSQSGAKFHVY